MVGVPTVSVDAVDPSSAASSRRALSVAELAWVATVPCALLLAVAIATLGPWVGTTFLAPADMGFFPGARRALLHPEHAEHGQFVVALGLAPLIVLATLLGARRGVRLPPAMARRLVRSAQLAVVAFVVVCGIAQRTFVYSAGYSFNLPFRQVYFTWPTLIVSALLTIAAVVALGREPVVAHVRRLARETPARRLGAATAAVAIVAAWVATAVATDASAGANELVSTTLPWSLEEPFAILNGLTPLVDFHAQYGQLLPWVAAGALLLAGTSVGAYTVTMALLSGAALLAVFAVLRRATRSSLLGLALFAPFLATSLFMKEGPADDRYGPANLFSVWPGRYFGPLVLLWLLARHLDGRAPRRTWPLLAVAGLVVLNNTEFGLAAFAATLAAVVCAKPPRSPRAWASLAGATVCGLLLAVAAVSALTLVASGRLPRLELLVEFARIYGSGGYMMLPMPVLGWHVVLFLTAVACVVVAAVRMAARDDDRLLTGLLAWSGTFGLLIGAYFAGRSHPQVLIDLFGAWALALCLLLVAAVRAVLARPSRRPTAPEVAVLAGFALACCSLAQLPLPWSEAERIARTTDVPALRQPAATAFVAASTTPGEAVVILTPLGHRIAYDLGLRNVSPYSSSEAIPTRSQLETTIAALREAGGRRVFLWLTNTWADIPEALLAAGFRQTRVDEAGGYAELVDFAPAP